jgi:hypothetical protein
MGRAVLRKRHEPTLEAALPFCEGLFAGKRHKRTGLPEPLMVRKSSVLVRLSSNAEVTLECGCSSPGMVDSYFLTAQRQHVSQLAFFSLSAFLPLGNCERIFGARDQSMLISGWI